MDLLETEMGNAKQSVKGASREMIKTIRAERKAEVRMQTVFKDILRLERMGSHVMSIGGGCEDVISSKGQLLRKPKHTGLKRKV